MLKAGTAQLDITPPLGSPMQGYFEERRAAGVHDPLYVRAFAIERDGGAIAIAVCDLIGVTRRFLDQAKATITERTGLPPERVLICCTHTHTGPPAREENPYTQFLAGRIADAVSLAWARREPAEVAWGLAQEPRVAFNRRYRMKDGTVQTNPGLRNPEVVEPVGPTDPDVGVLCLRRPAALPAGSVVQPAGLPPELGGWGGPLGLLANFTLHYVGIPQDKDHISADYFGFFSEMIQRMRGERFVAALSNGAAGDINNWDVLHGARHANDHYQHTERVAGLVAAAALWAWNGAEFHADVPVGGAMTEIVLKRRPAPTDAERARAAEIDARVAAGQRVLMGERSFANRVARRMDGIPEETRTWVQALRVGDLAFVGAPGEIFVELGLEIKRRSPFAQTIVFDLANDSVGYIPTARAFEEGAYEPESSPFTPGFGEQIVEAGVRLLHELYEA